MSRSPRFEICRGDDGWWARFRAANGRVVWVTETYERRRAAENAMRAIVDTTTGGYWIRRDYGYHMALPRESGNPVDIRSNVEVREVDER